jgi:hypothetical protein
MSLENTTITTSDGTKVDVHGIIGQGGQARAYNGTEKRSGKRVIAKEFIALDAAERDAIRRRTEFLVKANLQSCSPIFHCAPYAWFERGGTFGHIAAVAPGMGFGARIENGWSPEYLDLLQGGLAYAYGICQLHDLGFAHGDLQCDNLFIDDTGGVLRIFLIDFDNYWHARQPAPQSFLGQELYLPPEVRKARDEGRVVPVDRTAELFSFSVSLMHLILLRHPAQSAISDPSLFSKVMTSGHWADDPQKNAGAVAGGYPSQVLNTQLQTLARRGLAVDSSRRPLIKEWAVALTDAVENVFVHDCGCPFIVDRRCQCPHCGQPFPGIALELADGRKIPIPGGGIQLGRDLLGGGDAISRHHANVARFGPEFRLTSFSSRGSYRATPNGWVRLPDNKPIILQVGDRLRFGEVIEATVFEN